MLDNYQYSKPLILGIDEAGRGAAVGDLILAGVVVSGEEGIRQLTNLKVTDSKKYSKFGDNARNLRSIDYIEIIKSSNIEVFTSYASAQLVDQAVGEHGLNRLEQRLARDIIGQVEEVLGIQPTAIILDGHNIFSSLEKEYSQAIAIDKAESKHISVAAASVIAKHIRDERLLAFYEKVGWKEEKGMGYCNKNTSKFFHYCATELKQWPNFIRMSFSWTQKQIQKYSKNK